MFLPTSRPRCPDCEKFTTSWERVADELKDSVTVAELDCASYSKVCKAFVVKNFPTFVWVEDGEVIESLGKEMSVKELVSYAKRKISYRLKREVTEAEQSEGCSDGITEVRGEDFSSTISTGCTLVIFCVPWCNYCRSALSTMLKLQNHFSDVQTFKTVKCDCSLDANADTCFIELSNGVPMVNLYCNGEVVVTDYHGTSYEELEDMIKRKIERREERRGERDHQHQHR